MLNTAYAKKAFWSFLILAGVSFIGSLIVFFHSYYLESYFNVHVFHDPRWRIFNFNSRQATEGDIYNVAEIPAVHKVRLTGHRRLRFEFIPPIKTSSWKVINAEDGAVNTQGRYPEVQFKDEPHNITCRFIPENVNLMKDLTIQFSFYPTENYQKNGMSWDDNYHKPKASVPFSLKKPYSIDEWVGLPDDDPEIIEAKRILGNSIPMNAPTLERSEQVYLFIMDKLQKIRRSAYRCTPGGLSSGNLRVDEQREGKWILRKCSFGVLSFCQRCRCENPFS